MSDAQSGIFHEGPEFHHHLEFRLNADADAHIIGAFLSGLNCADILANHLAVVGVGPTLAGKLFPETVPENFRAFDALGGPAGFHAPSTQHDLWLWLQGSGPDVLFDQAIAAQRALGALGEIALEVSGFAYRGNLDLIGFVDGTANPKDDAGKRATALIPGTGAAFAMTQKWIHDLTAFEALPISEQEKVVGRTKVENIELEGDDMPPDSHVARTDASLDGVALKVYRRSTPYGSVAEHGLHYVAFACDLVRFDIQLQRMYATTDDGIHDRLIEFSKAVSGAYWYVPSLSELRKLS